MQPEPNFIKRRTFIKQASLAGISLAIAASNMKHLFSQGDQPLAGDKEISNLFIGVGKADITDDTAGINLQGFADGAQVINGCSMRLFARAFIMANSLTESDRTLMVVCDIWTCTLAIKKEVMARIKNKSHLKEFYSEDNVIISGTHTHSAAGGFSNYFLYNVSGGGFDLVNFGIIVDGIMSAIEKAHHTVSPGKVFIHKGEVEDCGRNRSIQAYYKNPISERMRYKSSIDKNMVLLKFVKDGEPVGILNWYGVHGATLGKENSCVSGDNKGWAARKFETEMDGAEHGNFVAAFGNSTAGDVSTNVGKNYKGMTHNPVVDQENLEYFGNQQYLTAKSLFNSATKEIQGKIEYIHTYVDMTCVYLESDKKKEKRTWPGAYGVSFSAGSTEDGGKGFISEGLRSKNLILNTINSLVEWSEEKSKFKGTIFNLDFAGKKSNLNLDKTVERQPWDARYPAYVAYVNGHYPKPILMPVGLLNEEKDPAGNKLYIEHWVPEVVPIQLIKIGSLVIVGFPGEITTMAGRRLRNTMKEKFGEVEVVIAAYSNEYSSYVTTREEYSSQQYEGASTLYGPYTLEAYQQEFSRLADDMMLKRKPMSAELGDIEITHFHPRSGVITDNSLTTVEESIKYFFEQTTQSVANDDLRKAINF